MIIWLVVYLPSEKWWSSSDWDDEIPNIRQVIRTSMVPKHQPVMLDSCLFIIYPLLH